MPKLTEDVLSLTEMLREVRRITKGKVTLVVDPFADAGMSFEDSLTTLLNDDTIDTSELALYEESKLIIKTIFYDPLEQEWVHWYSPNMEEAIGKAYLFLINN